MSLGIYPRTEEHNKHISEAKKRYYAQPENRDKVKARIVEFHNRTH